jgi:hypothetical protein
MWAFRYKAEDPTSSWRIRIMIALVWVTSALLSFIPIFTDLFTTKEHAQIINNLDYEDGLCSFVVNTPYRIVSSLVSFWLPGIGMVVFYCLVMRKAYKCVKMGVVLPKKTSKSGSQANNQDVSSYSLKTSVPKGEDLPRDSPSGQTSNYDERNFQRNDPVSVITAKERNVKWNREYKALKTLGTVILIFLLCWFFFFLNYALCNNDEILNCAEVFGKKAYVDDILFWIGYSNSMINPFLYNFTNHDFRRAFRSLLNLDYKKNRVMRINDKPRKSFPESLLEKISLKQRSSS